MIKIIVFWCLVTLFLCLDSFDCQKPCTCRHRDEMLSVCRETASAVLDCLPVSANSKWPPNLFQLDIPDFEFDSTSFTQNSPILSKIKSLSIRHFAHVNINNDHLNPNIENISITYSNFNLEMNSNRNPFCVGSFSSLRLLDLSHNRIANVTYINWPDFCALPVSLETILLKNNSIENVYDYRFYLLKNLKLLDVSDNDLILFDVQFLLYSVPLLQIDLSNNPNLWFLKSDDSVWHDNLMVESFPKSVVHMKLLNTSVGLIPQTKLTNVDLTVLTEYLDLESNERHSVVVRHNSVEKRLPLIEIRGKLERHVTFVDWLNEVFIFQIYQ